MKITWLGQAGLLLEKDGYTVMIDPYLSDSVGKTDPDKHRRVPVEPSFLTPPDILILTHAHLDHYDPETVRPLLAGGKRVTVLAPSSVFYEIRKTGGGHRYVLFDQGTRWSAFGLRFSSVKAVHSDPTPIGVIVTDGEKKYYVTGDTLYNETIFPQIPDDIFALFLPVNGEGNNMNAEDAHDFCERIAPAYAVPLHFGLFDDCDPSALNVPNIVIPEIYKEIKFK